MTHYNIIDIKYRGKAHAGVALKLCATRLPRLDLSLTSVRVHQAETANPV